MKILLIFTLCLISDGGASKKVTGYSGGGIFINCKYDTEYTYNQKYFCKGSMSVCSDQIKTGNKTQWVNSGRFSLFDDTNSSEFRVMIRELTVQDKGTYQCGVGITSGNDINTSVKLRVKTDRSYGKSISKTAHAGEDLTVSCKYPKSYTSHLKFVCRWQKTASCSYNTSVKESKKYVKTGKISLYDDREKQIFSVSIRDVTEQDSGEYWCGAEVPRRSDQGYKVYFTRIDLTVTADLTPSSHPAGFSASTVITVSVILLLLLIGIIILILTLKNRHKMQAGTTFQNSGTDQGVSLDVHEYEELKDTRRLSASNAEVSTVYVTAQLPTISSDHHAAYVKRELTTNPCDSAAQQPTIPSDQNNCSKA
ncbi:polymeric immunoglobulin receptor-like isoform X3 [Tachysurus fulvidraco]|uniref:polymeric immunoglobulin receptor-like isoform X3 n=1 Tax=Tachysurus fulvidraco TaxID=1234273 RepID=UPI001FF0514B|nr:polymeric immunoglobulin receptor-like isoform X3 [Tachysurus fulvidraco]